MAKGSNNLVNITISEEPGVPPTTRVTLDNEPLRLAGLGTGNPPGSGAQIQWVIDPQSADGWAFSSTGGINIKSAGSAFEDGGLQAGSKRYIWRRKVADSQDYAYSISLTKTVSGAATQKLVIDPTIINQP